MEYMRKREEENVIKLNKLIALTESLNIQTRSKLDPLAGIRNSSNNFRWQVSSLLDKYKTLFQVMVSYDNEADLTDYWLFSIGSNTIIYDVLKGAIPLILDRNLKTFREGINSNFTTYLLDFYFHLFHYKELLSGDHEEQLDKTIVTFENNFKRIYMIENNGLIKYDEVRDILSTNHNIVASLEIKNEDIVRKGFFRMTMTTLYRYTMLVEIAYLKNNNIAIFRINSNELPTTIGSPRQFLHRLVQGEYQLLHLGKVLLFSVIRQYDLQIEKELSNGVELKTKTGNGVELKLTSVDPIQWDTCWRLYFHKLFNLNNIRNGPSMHDIDRALRKPSSSSLNFIEKHEKLSTNPFIDNETDIDSIIGLGIEVESSKEVTPIDDSPENKISRNNSGFSLHRSNPLGNLKEHSKSQISSTNPFKKSLTGDDCIGKVSELGNNNLAITLEQTVNVKEGGTNKNIPESRINEFKINDNVNDNYTNFLEQANKDLNTDRKEKLECDSDNVVDVKKELQNADYIAGKATHDRKIMSVVNNTKGKISREQNTTPIDSENDPFTNYIDAFMNMDGVPIFEESEIKISFWNGTGWESIMKNIQMKLAVITVQGMQPMLLYYGSGDMYLSHFAIFLTSDCKVGKATAQDVQIRFPQSNLCHSSITGSSVMNIRTAVADKILLILQNCILGKQQSVSHNTSTQMNSHPNIQTEYTQVSASEQPVILLSNMKTKLHILKASRWYPTSIGKLLITAEITKNKQTVRFNYVDSNNKETNIVTDDWKLQRLGNTGITLTKPDTGVLFEFVNKNVTDEVWKILVRYHSTPFN